MFFPAKKIWSTEFTVYCQLALSFRLICYANACSAWKHNTFLAGCGGGHSLTKQGQSGFPRTRRTAISLSQQLVHSPKAHALSSWVVTSLELPFYKSSSVSCRIHGESCSCSLKFTLKFLTSCSVSCEIRTVPYDKCVWRQLSGQRMLVHHLPLLFCLGLRVSAHNLPSFANLSNKSDKGFALGRKPIRGSAPGMANNADWMTLYGIRRRRYGFW